MVDALVTAIALDVFTFLPLGGVILEGRRELDRIALGGVEIDRSACLGCSAFAG